MGVTELVGCGEIQPDLEAVYDASISANFHAAHLLVDGSAPGTKHHELTFTVDQVVVKAVCMSTTSGEQIGRRCHTCMGVSLNVHPKGARIDLERAKFIQHHKRRHQIRVVTCKSTQHRDVLNHGALTFEYLRHLSFSALAPHT